MSLDYIVKTHQFEGPLDLLLHLIREDEIGIFSVDILDLAEKYIGHLRLLEFSDLQEAGAFLEMAATLISIKARQLIPSDSEKEEKDGEEPSDEDLGRSLQERLALYECFRKAAEELGAALKVEEKVYTASEHVRLAEIYGDLEAPLVGDAPTLIILYEQMLKGLSERKEAKVNLKTHRISVEETIVRLEKEVQLLRFGLFQGMYAQFDSRDALVVHILALLELVKMKKIHVYQEDLLGPLWLMSPQCSEADLPTRGDKESFAP